MFLPNLTNLYIGSRPNLYGNWALGVLTRLLWIGNRSLIERWAAWAGGTVLQYEPPTANSTLSSAVLIYDGTTAIWCFEGTRNVQQIASEIALSIQSESPNLTGLSHVFFRSNYFAQRRLFQANLDLMGRVPMLFVGHSLGGALAYIGANDAITNGTKIPLGVLSWGNPRVGNYRFGNTVQCPIVRWTNFMDPIPSLPIASQDDIAWLHTMTPLAWMPGYVHVHDGWHLFQRGGFGPFTGEAFPSRGVEGHWFLFFQMANEAIAFTEQLLAAHAMRSYLDRIWECAGSQLFLWDWSRCYALNSLAQAIEDNTPIEPIAVSPQVHTVAWRVPGVVIPTDGSMPTVPSGDVGLTIERRSVVHSLFEYGGDNFMAHKFRGKDRRLLTNLAQVCEALQARDARTFDPKPTHTLSNRVICFPAVAPAVGATLLNNQLQFIKLQAEILLAQ